MKVLKNHFVGFTFVLWTIGCFAFLQWGYIYHLAYRIQSQLFLYSSDYISGYLDKPALFACLSGDFLTQFFFFRFGGPYTISLLILALGIIIYDILRRFILNGQKLVPCIIALLFMTWELLRNCGTNYELSSTISLLGGLAAFYIFKSTPNRIKWFGILLIPLFYWLFGYGIFVFILLLIIDQLRGKQYIIPVVFTITSIIIPVATRQHYHLTNSQAYQYPASSFIDKPDFQFEKLLALSVESSSGHWGKVATLTEKDPQKSSIIAYFYNLSHGMMGDLPDKILETYQPGPLGLLIQLKPTTPLFSIWNSSEAWFQLGDMTMAEHSAILGMIFSPKHRSAKMVMRLAEINMINGDTAATSKYLIMLQKTWLYKQWAQERIPGHESEYVKGWLKEKKSDSSTGYTESCI